MPRVLLACCGLDHAHRGYESFARECFEALRVQPGIEIELVKGSGPAGSRERALRTLRRDRATARTLGQALGARPFRIEALAFSLSLQPLIAQRRPDLIYLSEWDTARGLAWLRGPARQRFRILLCNGGFAARGFDHLDRVQELTPPAREYVIEHGGDPARHTVLPLGLRITPQLERQESSAQSALRSRLDLPLDRPIVISVAALNRTHKRLDYLIEEVARLPEPRPFVLMVGEPDSETDAIRRLAATRLGAHGYATRTVRAVEVADLLRAADVFALASLVEAQGRAMIEAMGLGIPCLAHDSAVSRFALGEHGRLGDLSRQGVLASLLDAEMAEPAEQKLPRLIAGHRHVYERFSWDRLTPAYVEFLREVAQQPPLRRRAGFREQHGLLLNR